MGYFTEIFFIVLSIAVIVYILSYLKTNSRVHILIEILFIFAYVCVMILFMFPQTISIIENIFGIQSGINFILYLSIFIAYFVLFILYSKLEEQRIQITKLTREIALMNKKKKK